MYGTTMLNEAITTEVMLVAYDYNAQQPRLFTKGNAIKHPELYNLQFKDAAEASAAAPIYFAPKVVGNQTLVDGGIIANNPSLYAYIYAIEELGKDPKNIRVLSVGTGEQIAVKLNVT